MLQNLDRLRVFYHVFSEKSIAAAAKNLHVSQSAVSQSLRKLENEINSHLFTRLHRRLVPTTTGVRLMEIVRPFVAELAMCLKTLEQAKDQPFGQLRIGAPVEFGKTYFPPIVAAFREKYPGVTFFIKFGDPGILLPMIEEGRIDFALVDVFLTQSPFGGNPAIYQFDPVTEEEVILACSRPYYEKSIKKDHSFKHLKRQRFIAYRHNAQTIKSWFKHHFGTYNVPLQVVLTVDSHQAVLSAISHHAGMGIVASHMVKDEIKRGRIVPIKTSAPEIINQIALVQLQDKVPPLGEKMFRSFLLRKIESMHA